MHTLHKAQCKLLQRCHTVLWNLRSDIHGLWSAGAPNLKGCALCISMRGPHVSCQGMQEEECLVRGRRQKPNTRWSEEETALLVDAVCVRGTGSWADILEQHRAIFHPTRSSVDLKDKWRNLVKVPAHLLSWCSLVPCLDMLPHTLGTSFMCVLEWPRAAACSQTAPLGGAMRHWQCMIVPHCLTG